MASSPFPDDWLSLKIALVQGREQTCRLMDAIPADAWDQQFHPDFSPIGWHLGHIGFTEALWLLSPDRQRAFLTPEYCQLFRADGLPKAQRCHLPPGDRLRDYLYTIRQTLEQHWETGETLQPSDHRRSLRLGWWIVQHESQHAETIAILTHLAGIDLGSQRNWTAPDPSPLVPTAIEIPPGGYWQGRDDLLAQDNEGPRHWVETPRFWIDTYPATRHQYQTFMDQGGYHKKQYWSAAGWQWRTQTEITQPLYWSHQPDTPNAPVYGISAYEASAYATFMGKRLPTEQEWERVAHQALVRETPFLINPGKTANFNARVGQVTPVNAYPPQTPEGIYDLLGNVWEWTASPFAPYTGFQAYPYPGYSAAYFDGHHWVLRGGSWATRPWALRSTFRNWYQPWVRQIFAGVRCAYGDGHH